ncbi:alginate lyase family protein [Klebsiella pneumoniae]
MKNLTMFFFSTIFVSFMCNPAFAAKDIYGCSNFANFKSSSRDFEEHIQKAADTKPQSTASIKLEGILPSDPRFIESEKSLDDMDIIQIATSSWASNISPKKSKNISKKYIISWVSTYNPNFNPIDEAKLGQLIKSYFIIKDEFSSTENHKIKKFLSAWGNGYLVRMSHSDDSSQWKSNWQSNRIRLVTLIAIAIDDDLMFQKIKKYYIKQIQNNIYHDGSTWDFRERDAIKYVIADLDALIDTSLAARGKGEDWYNLKSNTGSSLSAAINWMLPYATGSKKHLEFANTNVKFDAIRAKAKVKGFSGYFKPETAANLFWIASLFQPKLQDIAINIRPSHPFFYRQCYE